MLKQWKFQLAILIIGLILLFSGLVGLFQESFQVIIKKAVLVSLWYGMTYLFRVQRIGHFDWEEVGEEMKIKYYFVLLIGAAIIIAWG